MTEGSGTPISGLKFEQENDADFSDQGLPSPQLISHELGNNDSRNKTRVGNNKSISNTPAIDS